MYIEVQTFGDFINFNPHLHIIASDGYFATNGGFMMGTEPDASSLIDLFRMPAQDISIMWLSTFPAFFIGSIPDVTVTNYTSSIDNTIRLR